MATRTLNIISLTTLLHMFVLCQVNTETPPTSKQWPSSTNLLNNKIQTHHQRPQSPSSAKHHRPHLLKPPDEGATTFKLSHIPQRFVRPPIDGDRVSQTTTNNRRQLLPTGPPPYRPAGLLVAASQGGLPTAAGLSLLGLKMKQRKIYYTFLDVMRNLHLLADQIARGQMKATGAKLHLLQSLIGRLSMLGGKSLSQLKWPLVMLNPHFLKELLSNPTFLVMLFHAIEVGYMSSASSSLGVLLKPLVKLVRQPSPEKEERTWWRRKRLYETFNGIGSSELQPNLRSIHFRRPGRPIQFSLPALSRLLPNFYDKKLLEPPKYKQPQAADNDDEQQQQQQHYDSELQTLGQADGESAEWLLPSGQQQLLLSQEEFEALDDGERDRIIQEARRNLEESLWTNALIQQQSSLVESLLQDKLGPPALEAQHSEGGSDNSNNDDHDHDAAHEAARNQYQVYRD